MQPTRKLYYEDAKMRTFCAVVIACKPEKAGFAVALDATAFYPEGGGQPADFGALGGAKVTDVHEQDGVIWHSVTTPLRTGEIVQGDIDWHRRLEFSQQHTGEHIVSGLIHAQFGYENVGFHIGQDVVRMDFSGVLSPTDLTEIEAAANWLIWQGQPIEIVWPQPGELATLAYRSKKELTGSVRIVKAGSADVCACCGTHVATCSEVGAVKILSSQSYKGGTRVTMVCGVRALADYTIKCSNAAEISQLLSAKPNEIGMAVQRLCAEQEGAKQRIAQLETALFAATAQQYKGAPCAFTVMDGLSPDGVRHLALALCEAAAPGALCAAFTQTESGFAFAACGGQDVRAFCTALTTALNGRGGGKAELVQGSLVCTKAQLEAFCASQTKEIS